uniref:protein-tyrosine-phosphatase n=2 Tax=Poecilia latipinna TaxID=48699 RepID=A0A3B3W224_9TELE
MLHEMRCYQAHDDIPICIHCSAGCGRTGALCVIDYTWNLLRSQMITSDFSIYNLVQEMRTQRPSVVQTKEQYLLVYRTIRELFWRYLQTMETQSCNTEVTMLQSAVAATNENDLSDESEELDLNPQHQLLLEEEGGYFQQYSSPLVQVSENNTAYKYEDLQWIQQQHHPFHGIPEALNATQDLHEGATNSPKPLHTIPAALTSESIPDKDDTSLLNSSSSPAVPEAVCLMVEDPYFDTPLSSPSSEEAPVDEGPEDSKWTCSPLFSTPSFLLNDQNMEPSSPTSAPADDEAPPPLPERTPESYFLAEEEELPDPCERLSVIFPPNAAAEPIGEQAGSPPSPAPPLPERTPESFELACDPVPVTSQARVPLGMNLGVIGLSSEWSGTLTPEDAIQQEKTFVRSKSLRAKMTLSAPTSVMQLDQTNFHTSSPPPVPMTPPPLPRTEDSLASPVAKRVPESFPFPAETSHDRNMQRPLSMGSAQSLPRVGMSSEWDGSSQPKKFLDAVMNRSKSVRAKSSRSEPLSAFPQLTPLPVVSAEGGSAQVEQQNINHRPTPDSDRSGSKADKSSEKSMLRTKSLKLFRHKSKPKTAPPPPPTQAGATATSHSSSFTVFKFGFGNRFGKPKGPRSYPETWI